MELAGHRWGWEYETFEDDDMMDLADQEDVPWHI